MKILAVSPGQKIWAGAYAHEPRIAVDERRLCRLVPFCGQVLELIVR